MKQFIYACANCFKDFIVRPGEDGKEPAARMRCPLCDEPGARLYYECESDLPQEPKIEPIRENRYRLRDMIDVGESFVFVNAECGEVTLEKQDFSPAELAKLRPGCTVTEKHFYITTAGGLKTRCVTLEVGE